MTLLKLEKRDVGGWEWTVDDDGAERRYRSNLNHEGLWVWVEDGLNVGWKQTRGTIQASWPRTRRGMLNRLRKEFGYVITKD